MRRCRLFCHNQGIYLDVYTSNKVIRRSSPVTLRKSVLRCYKIDFAFFLPGFSSTNIHNSQDSRGRGGYLFMTCLICLINVMICIFDCEEFVHGTFEDCIGFCNSHTIATFISESLLGKNRVTMAILQNCLGTTVDVELEEHNDCLPKNK